MSTDEASAGPSEQAIEAELTAMVVRFDRVTGRSTGLGCVTSLGLLVAGGYFGGWKGGLAGVVGLFVLLGLSARYDAWVLARLVRRFQKLYPPGGPAHATALQVLAELESESKALDKLKQALRKGDTGEGVRVTRRRTEPTAEQQLANPAGPPPSGPGANVPPVELLSPGPAPPPATRPVKSTPVIPLEPFEPEPAEKRDERDPGTRSRD